MNFIVTQLKNEKRRVQEWVDYHFHVGFDIIIIYIDYPTDGTDDLIKEISLKNKNVIYFFTTHGVTVNYNSPNDYHGNVAIAYSLAKSYMEGLKYIKDNYKINQNDWVAFIDVDEYIVQTGDNKLIDFLSLIDPTIDRIYLTSYDMKCPIDLDYPVIDQSLYRWSDKTRNTLDKNGDIVERGLFSSRGKSISRIYNLNKIDCCHTLDSNRDKTPDRKTKVMSSGGDIYRDVNSVVVDVFHDKEYFKLFHYRNHGILQIYDEYDDSALRIKNQYSK